jgi:hypothetical protein
MLRMSNADFQMQMDLIVYRLMAFVAPKDYKMY